MLRRDRQLRTQVYQLKDAVLFALAWGFGRDLRTIVGYRGLSVGISLSWILYFGLIIAFHKLFGWMRELF